MDAGNLFSGADNTSLQPALGSNFCIRPQNCVFQNRICADAAVSSHDCAAAQLCARIDDRAARFALRPFARFDEIRFPIFSQDCAVHFEIFSARRDVEPFSVVHHQAADLTTFLAPWPIQSAMIGINEIFLRGGIRWKITEFQTAILAKSKFPATP